jgi:hypothetical protein
LNSRLSKMHFDVLFQIMETLERSENSYGIQMAKWRTI